MDVKFLLRKAYEVAMFLSTDPSTQVGALLVNDNGDILTREANHFPKGVAETPERWKKETKYFFVEHSERNLIYRAAKEGISTKNKTMIATWYSCADCARAIICSGIKKVIGHQLTLDLTPDRWKESVNLAHIMLQEADIECVWVDEKIGDVEIRFDGKVIYP